jgi:hypothetical protein
MTNPINIAFTEYAPNAFFTVGRLHRPTVISGSSAPDDAARNALSR